MASSDRKHRLFDQIVRLRRAARAAPDDRDIVAVCSQLEQDLGETVSRRFAAAMLGVSHTALGRWIERGDLPVIENVAGREQVPVSALLDLSEAVTRERGAGRRRRHVLEPTMAAGRDRATDLRTSELISDVPMTSTGHDRADRRSLAYHRAVARQLRRRTIDDALHLVWTWRDQGRIDPRHAEEWEHVLRQPVAEVRHIIGEDSPSARDLRQTSPFAGVLSEAERRKILEEIR